jgi:hypothetical protein
MSQSRATVTVNRVEREAPRGVHVAAIHGGRRTRWCVRCTYCGREPDGWWLPKQYRSRAQAAAVAHAHRERHRAGYA